MTEESRAEDGLVLSLDLGTTGLKVGLVSIRGEVLWWDQAPLTTHYSPDGGVTQDATEWWRLVVELTQAGAAATGRGADVVGVGITGQWASTVPVHAEGTPVDDCVMWMDRRGAPYSNAVVGGPIEGYSPFRLATWVRRSAGVPTPSGADPIGHMLHLRHDRPETSAATQWFLEPVDYLAMRFTGEAAASPMSMTAAWLTDNRRPERLAYDRTLLRISQIDHSKLPPLVASGTVIATVRPDVAAALGISASARVVTGMPDLHAATLGSGCVRPGDAHLSLGTTGWVSCPLSKKKTNVFSQMATVPGIGPLRYLLGNNQETAGRCLQWFREGLAGWGDEEPPTYEEILEAAGSAPPGANGVVFTPWLTGERCPVDDADARAGFHHLSVTTTQADMARAVLEGVAFNSRWMLEAADAFVGRRLDPLRIVGGGARSDLWCQIVADVCRRTVERVQEPLLTGLRGAALGAAVALGDLRLDDLHGLTPVDAVFTPDPATRSVYETTYAQYPKLYKAQRPLSRALSSR